jgi:hypothetical protein
MTFRRLRLFFRRHRRYRSAVYSHADLSRDIEAPLLEKIWRWLFKPEYCDSDGSTARMLARVRQFLTWALIWGAGWFTVESLRAWNIFSGD